MIVFASLILLPNNLISKCPAIMLAVRRTARDPGRIKFLIVSIKTIKGIKIGGVPLGIMWANISWVLLIHPNSIILIHRGRASDKVYDKCLLLVKIYGSRPIILFTKININNEIIIKLNPCLFFPSKVLNSLNNWLNNILKIILIRLGMIQYIEGIIINLMKVLIQLSEKFILVEGSKVENRFVIIFRLN